MTIVSEVKRGILPGLKEEIVFLLSALPEIVLDQRTLWRRLSPFHSVPYETVRTAVHRGCRDGLINKSVRNGISVMRATKRGRAEAGGARDLKGLRRPRWDGTWRLLSFDIPERDRRARNTLRQRLRELGYGQLHKSVWISPHDLLAPTRQFVDDQGLGNCVWFFRAHLEKGIIPAHVIRAAWPHLEAINRAYHQYVERWTTTLAVLSAKTDPLSLKMAHQLARFQLGMILSKDPQLPKALRPAPWGMTKALACYRQVRAHTRS